MTFRNAVDVYCLTGSWQFTLMDIYFNTLNNISQGTCFCECTAGVIDISSSICHEYVGIGHTYPAILLAYTLYRCVVGVCIVTFIQTR